MDMLALKENIVVQHAASYAFVKDSAPLIRARVRQPSNLLKGQP